MRTPTTSLDALIAPMESTYQSYDLLMAVGAIAIVIIITGVFIYFSSR